MNMKEEPVQRMRGINWEMAVQAPPPPPLQRLVWTTVTCYHAADPDACSRLVVRCWVVVLLQLW